LKRRIWRVPFTIRHVHFPRRWDDDADVPRR